MSIRARSAGPYRGGSPVSSSGFGLSQLPAEDQLADYVPITMPKIEAAAANGTADAYFDDFVLKNATPNCPAVDFAYRNG
jgi:hypothetical protein